MNLAQLIDQLGKSINNASLNDSSVSKRGIDWHIDHCLKIIIVTSEVLVNSDESKYRWKFNLYRAIFLPLGYFPRGRVRAPRVVNNKEEIVLEDLTLQLEKAKILVKQLANLPSKSNFKHPFFGVLNLSESERFMEVHTHHHMKIINMILNKN